MANFGEMELRGYDGIALGSVSAIFIFHWGIKSINIYFSSLIFVLVYFLQLSDFKINFAISISAALLIPSLYQNNNKFIARLLAFRIFVWLGRLTFSIYMMHVLCLNVVKIFFSQIGIKNWLIIFFTGYAFSVLVAWILFKIVEYPLIIYGKKLADG
jgi:peptidoglycan/LPS O-acetylase OafA/YrhL